MVHIKYIVFIFFYFLLSGSFNGYSQVTVKVNIRVMEEDTGKIVPVMVCITHVKDGLPRIPPSAEIPITQSMHMTQKIYKSGVRYEKNSEWIGPVRMMSGKGDNDDRSYVYELLPSLPYWSEPVMYQTSGNFSIELPPGRWRISLEHGNEFIPIREEFTVSKKDKELTKKFILKRWINLPQRGWYSGDVHVHHPTTKPEFKDYLLEYAKAEDLHLISLLEQGDDHVIEGAPQEGFGEKFRVCKEDICLVSGQEDPSSRFGHIIGLNIDQLVRDTSVYNYYDIVFKKLHQQPGALVGFAHFSWNGCDLPRGFPWLVTTNEIDFVELLQFSKINTLDYYDYLNLGFHITAAAGSDFPWGSTMGEVRTVVYTGNKFSVDNWFKGLRAGNTFVTNGPALFFEADGSLPGTELVKESGSTTQLKIKAISHSSIGKIKQLAIYNNEGLIAEKRNTSKSDSLEITLMHALKESQWIAAMVTCDNGAVAHTSPFYFIVDNQPTWNVRKAPGIIQKQLEALENTELEEKSRKIIDDGIIKRIANARAFYEGLTKGITSTKK
jgi:hypothetical protein